MISGFVNEDGSPTGDVGARAGSPQAAQPTPPPQLTGLPCEISESKASVPGIDRPKKLKSLHLHYLRDDYVIQSLVAVTLLYFFTLL